MFQELAQRLCRPAVSHLLQHHFWHPHCVRPHIGVLFCTSLQRRWITQTLWNTQIILCAESWVVFCLTTVLHGSSLLVQSYQLSRLDLNKWISSTSTKSWKEHVAAFLLEVAIFNISRVICPIRFQGSGCSPIRSDCQYTCAVVRM